MIARNVYLLSNNITMNEKKNFELKNYNNINNNLNCNKKNNNYQKKYYQKKCLNINLSFSI